MKRAGARRLAAAMTAATMAFAVVGCTGDEAPEPSGTTTSASPAPAGQEVAIEASLGTVAGDLARPARSRVVSQVSEVVDAWIEAAYGGTYPRSDFSDAYPGFTERAARLAGRSADLMTNADIGASLESVEFTRRAVVVDVITDQRGRPVGATARVRLAFTTAGEVSQDVTVRGRLLLTRGPRAWRVFGFDMAKGTN